MMTHFDVMTHSNLKNEYIFRETKINRNEIQNYSSKFKKKLRIERSIQISGISSDSKRNSKASYTMTLDLVK